MEFETGSFHSKESTSFQETLNQLKTPPQSLEAEQGVIGALMLSGDNFDAVAELVQAADFYHPQHRLIFNAMNDLAKAGRPLDLITVSESLDNNRELGNAGGLAYLAELAKNTPSVSNMIAYARIVRERAILRQLISIAQEIANSGFNPEGRDTVELLSLAEEKVASIAEGRAKEGGFNEVDDLLKKVVQRIDDLYNSESDITGLTTGFKDLDKMTSGWQKGDMVVIAARPSMGKTALAMNAVENALLHGDGKPVLVFSMEMPAESLIMRMLSSIGKIDQTRVRSGKLEQGDWDKLQAAVIKLRDKPLFIDDTPGISTAELRGRVRRHHKEHGEIGLIMVDYLQLMRGSSSNSENRTNEVSDISRSLKAVAREFKCPILVLSQLSRAVESRPNKRPINSDLRESGAIEQDADVILFIYRDEVYNEESKDKGMAEIIIGKQRNGPIGTARLSFQGKYTRFDNLAHDFEANNYQANDY
jgi:replicative DNA helicase